MFVVWYLTFLNSGSFATELKAFNMGTETNKDERNTPEYLAQLLKDKKQIQAFPSVFIHLEKLLDEGKWRCKMLYETFQDLNFNFRVEFSLIKLNLLSKSSKYFSVKTKKVCMDVRSKSNLTLL